MPSPPAHGPILHWGPALPGAGDGSAPPPGGYRTVVAAEENRRDVAPSPRRGPRVGGRLQEATLEGLLGRGLGVAHHAGQEPRDALHYDERGELAAGDDVVPDRDGLETALLQRPLVHPLVAAAEEHEVRFAGQLPEEGLGERPACRHEHDAPPRAVGARRQRLHGIGDHVRPENHAWAPPEDGVVDLAVPAPPEVPDVRDHDVDDARPHRPPQQAPAQVGRDELREYREDVDAHAGARVENPVSRVRMQMPRHMSPLCTRKGRTRDSVGLVPDGDENPAPERRSR